MNNGDIVRIRPNFHRPSRVGQEAKIIATRSVGVEERNISFQYLVFNEKLNLLDWIDERYLELVEESHEYDEVIDELNKKVYIDPVEVDYSVSYVKEAGGKRFLDL